MESVEIVILVNDWHPIRRLFVELSIRDEKSYGWGSCTQWLHGYHLSTQTTTIQYGRVRGERTFRYHLGFGDWTQVIFDENGRMDLVGIRFSSPHIWPGALHVRSPHPLVSASVLVIYLLTGPVVLQTML